jgi:hypothetical protein
MTLLFRSICLLCINFNNKYKYPIVVFHDDLSKQDIANLRVSFHNELGYIPEIKFEILDLSTPPNISLDKSKYYVNLEEFPISYRSMCNFQCWQIYQHEALKKYDYYWRLDSDSYILNEIKYDVFDYMQSNNYEYAFLAEEDRDVPLVVEGLWETTKEFIEKYNIVPTSLNKYLKDGKWDYNYFYTNFEISKFSFWRSDNYKLYYNHINSTGNIFYGRWGDAPIHWLAVRMFMENKQIWCIKDIAYQHNAWIKNLSSIPNKDITSISKYIDGNEKSGRLGRLIFAMERYKNTGIDGVNWCD